MVIFNELRISDDKQSLTIDCAVEGLDIYSDMYIKNIYLEYYKNASTYGVPSTKAIKVYDDEDSLESKAVRICVDAAELALHSDFGTATFDKGLFYVIVNCDGDLPADVSLLSCGMDNTVDVGVALDWKRIYQVGMQYISSLNAKCFDACGDLTGYKSFVLIWYALRFAISSCDYVQVERTWENFLKIYSNNNTPLFSAGCGCQG